MQTIDQLLKLWTSLVLLGAEFIHNFDLCCTLAAPLR